MFSEKFQDIYFQPDEGIQESRHVFIEGNKLLERFKYAKDFSICELGFGTGLNFLLTTKLFLEHNTNGTLYYYSIEKYPLLQHQIQNALKTYDEIKPQVNHFLNLLKLIYYPTQGFQTIYFHPRIRLTLLLGDVLEMLKEIPENTKFDAWYLDGFAPSKNPEMWEAEIYLEMAKHSFKDTTFATFTCARVVKDGLQKANFKIQKRKGYKQKKEMLIGYYNQDINKKEIHNKNIAIIGAGIAGTTIALQLLKKNHNVHVFDLNQDIWEGASGIPSALLMPYVSNQINDISDYSIKGYNIFISFLFNFLGNEFYNIFKKNIIISKDNYINKLNNFINNYKLPYYIYKKYKNSFISSRGGVLDTKLLKSKFKEILFESLNFYFYPKTKIIDIRIEKDHIILQDHKHHIYEFDHLIFCNSNNMIEFSILKPVDFFSVRGQLIQFKSPFLNPIKTNVSDISFYQIQNKIILGSSFEHYLTTKERHRDSDIFLLKKLEKHFPNIFHLIAVNTPNYDFKIPTEAFIGLRCQSKDYLPCVGNIVNWDEFIIYLNSLEPNKRYYYKDISIPVYHHLWLNSCHGTRGYTTAFLSSEIIASLINNDPIPIEGYMIHQTSPARYIFRKWRSSQNRKIFNLE